MNLNQIDRKLSPPFRNSVCNKVMTGIYMSFLAERAEEHFSSKCRSLFRRLPDYKMDLGKYVYGHICVIKISKYLSSYDKSPNRGVNFSCIKK